MSKEQQKQPAKISREELYRQVWETPMFRLAAQYGVSGNGLKKICNRLNVPYPPRGYWAKLSAGKSVKQTPLSTPPAGTALHVTITPTPQLAGDFLNAIVKQASDPGGRYEGRSGAEWIAWARERRDAFDPSRWNVGDLWADLASVTAWEYRDCH